MADFFTATIQQIENHLKAGEFDAALPLGKKLVEQAPAQHAPRAVIGVEQHAKLALTNPIDVDSLQD